MKQKNVKPADYCRRFSTRKNAGLYLHIVDERSYLDRFLLGQLLGRLLYKIGADYIAYYHDHKIAGILARIKKEYNQVSPQTIINFLKKEFFDDYLRKFEYAFLIQCLIRKDVRKEVVVDLGGGGSFSTIAPALLRLSEMRIISIDVTHQSAVSKYGIEYVKGDCMNTSLADASVDVVTIISTLEHVGLGRYGDPLDVDGDLKTMRETWRILKPGGHAIITIPYGYPTVVYNLHRVYDKGRVAKLMKGFAPIIMKYSRLGKFCSQKELEGKKVTKLDQQHHPDPQGGLLALLKKL